MFKVDTENKSLYLYGVIGDDFFGDNGITSERVLEAVAEMPNDPITVYINSPGGQADEGIAIYNILRRHAGGVTTIVDSLAASAASVIAMAGTKRRSMNGSRWMIHRALAVAIGNKDEMRAMARVLETYDQSIAEIYSAGMSVGKEEILSAMTRESWYTSEEAVAAGLATELDQVLPTQSPMNAAWFENAPTDLMDKTQARVKPVAAKRLLARLNLKVK
jgi:ATP-dependent Clp endopeptidase proteolytic subunit ClpP